VPGQRQQPDHCPTDWPLAPPRLDVDVIALVDDFVLRVEPL
jgi:hypothetical protein